MKKNETFYYYFLFIYQKNFPYKFWCNIEHSFAFDVNPIKQQDTWSFISFQETLQSEAPNVEHLIKLLFIN